MKNSVILKLEGIKENHYSVIDGEIIIDKNLVYIPMSPNGNFTLLSSDKKHKHVRVSKDVIKFVTINEGPLKEIIDGCYEIKQPSIIIQGMYYISKSEEVIYKLNLTKGLEEHRCSDVIKRFNLKVINSNTCKRFKYDDLIKLNTPNFISDKIDKGYKYLDMYAVAPYRYLINDEGMIYDTILNIYLKETDRGQCSIKFEKGGQMLVKKLYLVNKMFNQEVK